ncbi:leucine-rich repeat-containing G-protein coupled receptor 4-like, partial [Stylophora pistillata]|uniref:leucine-rich repeat-containing G-protein coupled receptor 4-like n=1 Tax=Stylophora pistillata TaxID=50429 RepID=UPI000C0539EE
MISILIDIFNLFLRDLSSCSLNTISEDTFRNLTVLEKLYLDLNPLGPSLLSDIFAGFMDMKSLSMNNCDLENIAIGTFRSMQQLQELDLGFNKLTHICKGTLEGLTNQLNKLWLNHNRIKTIGDETFKQLTCLEKFTLTNNLLTTVPDLKGLTFFNTLSFERNRIIDVSRIATSGN